MRRLLVAMVVATLGAAGLLTPTGAGAEARRADVVRLDGVRVELRAGTTQVVTVDHTRGVRARVSLWRLAADGWERQLTTTDGRTGYGGFVDGDRRRQGSGTTPLGTYGLISTFGTHAADRRALLPHHRIRKGDHWVQDNASDFYNQLRNQRDGGFRWWLPASDPNSSERLTDYHRQYEWSIVTDFNVEQVRHRGSGIFLHVNGRGATAGCVSAPRRFIRSLVRLLDPARVPVIAVGR
ncbi:L,D-transpeptidase family protein [Nocardioides cavernae]|uniref:L,D-transpeptidase family protein n=1 Tax=Nocardioides cavernae TaxID=1921566 RepID=A0ABR8NH50_9ACTN|nr:L,D-transpeptidase family protein [Nocardioides cavernae]MBD3926475.1 L,D-transpeptidase family protein [Nocardioides cavernae]MBM7512194.1 L,D-peptidoglycan transpeptidase YkuD (ErfK/YbiS/YcfS/YnhG family) [Nocardioides cavernae]